LIHVEIDAVSEANGANIISYNIEIDDGQAGAFTELVGATANSLSLSAQKASGIVQGLYYRVRYRARN
jgi:hypothetical protein